jgi:colicin import membrane protein
MRYVCIALVWLAGSAWAAADTSNKTLAENAFKTADKNNDQKLDESELREARRILKAALLKGVPADVAKAAHDQIDKLTEKQIPGAKDGVSSKEFEEFVKSLWDSREQIIKAAQQKAAQEAAAQKQREDEARRKAAEAAARKKQQQQQQQQQRNHNKKR